MKKHLTILTVIILLTSLGSSFGENVATRDHATATVDRPWYNHVKAGLWSLNPSLGKAWSNLVTPLFKKEAPEKTVISREKTVIGR